MIRGSSDLEIFAGTKQAWQYVLFEKQNALTGEDVRKRSQLWGRKQGTSLYSVHKKKNCSL